MLRFGCLLVIVASANALNMSTLIRTFSMSATPGTDSFFYVPRTVQEAKDAGFVQPEETIDNPKFSTYCEQDNYHMCGLYDNKGSIAGYQLSVKETAPIIDLIHQGFLQQTLFNVPVYSNLIWFVHPDVVENGGRDFDGQTGTGLWLQIGKNLTEIPAHESGMQDNDFKKQNCFIRMGQHYFYKAYPEMTKTDFMPWFVLYDKEQNLSGFGFVCLGKVDQTGKTPVYENVSLGAILAIAPSSPEWLKAAIEKYGIFSNHVYFQPEPWKITCDKPQTFDY